LSSRENLFECRAGAAALICLGIAVCLLTPGGAVAADIDSPDYWREGWKELAALGKGFVVWESNRTGLFRIWRRNLDGSGLRQVSPDEDGRSHYAAHVSPDGKKLVYMSFPENRWQDGYALTPEGETRPMHLINVDGTGDRVILEDARTYYSHRAVVWFNEKEIICIDGNGVTQQLNVETGESIALTSKGQDEYGWLINTAKTFATCRAIWITFSPYDPVTKTVTPSKIYGGCMPYFARDGVWGFYMGGSGGPINRVRLATGKVSPIIKHNDPSMPAERRHMYYPMLSANQRLLAFGAAEKKTWERAPGSDYDIFVAQCKPNTLELVGKPARYSFSKSLDRYPDVFLDPNEEIAILPTERSDDTEAQPAGPPWPTKRDGLVFLWENSDKPNLTTDPATGKQRSYIPRLVGRVWFDHNHALHMVGKGAVVAEEAGPKVVAACKKTNAFSVEATLLAGTTQQGSGSGAKMRPARIVTLGPMQGDGEPNAALGQRGQRLLFKLKAGEPKDEPAGKNRKDRGWLNLNCTVKVDEPIHVVVTYEPGKLAAYVNGEETLTTDAVQGDLSGWAPGELLLGGLKSTEEAWSGNLEGIALYDRALSAKEAGANCRNYRAILEARKTVAKFTFRGKLLARAKLPSQEELGTYRSALVVYEYETEKRDGLPPPVPFRVAHWGVLDKEYLGLDKRKKGEIHVLKVEFFSDNPQLESALLCLEPLDEAPDIPLYFETGR